MSDRSKRSKPRISPDIASAISSRALEVGRWPLPLPDGVAINRYGRVVAPVSLSALPTADEKSAMHETYSLYGCSSLDSRRLQLSLESRLRARLASGGSTLYALKWSVRTTPWPRPICALRASVPRTSASGSTGWPSPVVNDSKGSDYTYANGDHNRISLKLGGAAKLARSTQAAPADGEKKSQTAVSPWATPAAQEAGGTPEQFLARKEKLAGACGVSLTSLSMQAKLASWATPTVRDHKDGASVGSAPTNCLLGRQAWLATEALPLHGQRRTWSPAPTGSIGQLNPAHSRWLMGYPAVWGSCGATAMQSFLKSRKRSSKA
jgi:hypothetical protein